VRITVLSEICRIYGRFYNNPDIQIPNTNNGLEGQFTDLKSKLRNHNGLSKSNRKIFIDEYFRYSV